MDKTSEGLAKVPLIRVSENDGVLPKRKKNLSFSFTMWSRRTLTESIWLGFDQALKNSPTPLPKSAMQLGMELVQLTSGKAFKTGWRALAADFRSAAVGT